MRPDARRAASPAYSTYKFNEKTTEIKKKMRKYDAVWENFINFALTTHKTYQSKKLKKNNL